MQCQEGQQALGASGYSDSSLATDEFKWPQDFET